MNTVTKLNPTAVMAMTLCLVASTAWARPLVPFKGKLDQDGVAANSPHDLRFGLFTNQAASTGCLFTVSGGGDCGEWWVEVLQVETRDGAFAVMLGQDGGKALPVSMLEREPLWLAIAVRGPGDSHYTLLSGKQRFGAAPVAASAKNFRVSGDFSADQKVTATRFSGLGHLPLNSIILWSGPVDQLPDGFVLCNGQNGTPDLRDRFVLGSKVGRGALNGNYNHIHQLTVASSGGNTGAESDPNTVINQNSASGSHTVPANAHVHNMNHTHSTALPTTSADMAPPYIVMAYIMRKN